MATPIFQLEMSKDEIIASHLCSRCTALDLEKLLDDSPLPAGRDYDILVILGDLKSDEIDASCAACQSFYAARIVIPGEDGPYRLCKVSWSCLQSPDAISWHEPRCVFAVINSRRSLFEFDRVTDLRFLGVASGNAAGPRVCQRPREVDFSLLRSWLGHCNAYHTKCRTARCTEPQFGTKVIDCRNWDVVSLGPEMEYLALSYVWGSEERQLTSQSFNLENLEVSPLIRDSMQATLELGFQYLWVDKFCISTVEAQRHEEIQNMDKIYSGAHLTIIAIVDSPQEGLPGMFSTSRCAQSAFRVGTKTILSTMDSPRETISQSTWNTRGWTLQEAVLSRRCVYFSREQVYFECKTMHQCETIDYIQQATDQMDSHAAIGPWSDGRQPSQSATVDPNHLLKTYFDRQLRYSSDAINAFAGILRSYARVEPPWYHHFGLIVSQNAEKFRAFNDYDYGKAIDASFQVALLWRAKHMTRRSGFPSWSWSGWTGANWEHILEDGRIPTQVFTHSKWVAANGQIITPGQALDSGALEADEKSWTHDIIVTGPMIDVQLDFGPELEASAHEALSIVIDYESDAPESLRIPFDRDYKPKGIAEPRYMRCVAIRVLDFQSYEVILVVGQTMGSESMERIGVLNFSAAWHFRDLAMINGLTEAKVQELFDKIPWTEGQVRVA